MWWACLLSAAILHSRVERHGQWMQSTLTGVVVSVCTLVVAFVALVAFWDAVSEGNEGLCEKASQLGRTSFVAHHPLRHTFSRD